MVLDVFRTDVEETGLSIPSPNCIAETIATQCSGPWGAFGANSNAVITKQLMVCPKSGKIWVHSEPPGPPESNLNLWALWKPPDSTGLWLQGHPSQSSLERLFF